MKRVIAHDLQTKHAGVEMFAWTFHGIINLSLCTLALLHLFHSLKSMITDCFTGSVGITPHLLQHCAPGSAQRWGPKISAAEVFILLRFNVFCHCLCQVEEISICFILCTTVTYYALLFLTIQCYCYWLDNWKGV